MLKTGIELSFPGTWEKAFNFYKSIFGVEFIGFIKIGDDPYTRENSYKEEHGKATCVALQLGNVIIVGDEAPGADIKQVSSGNMMSIGIVPDSKEKANRIFNGLAEGARAIKKMADYPLGYIGSVLDQYVVNWGGV